MQKYLGACLVVMLVAGALAGVTQEEVSENSRFPGKCYDAKRNEGYAVGAKWHRVKEPCAQFTCEAGSAKGKFIIKKTSCDSLERPKPPCRIEEGNYKARYPGCCASIKCPSK